MTICLKLTFKSSVYGFDSQQTTQCFKANIGMFVSLNDTGFNAGIIMLFAVSEQVVL